MVWFIILFIIGLVIFGIVFDLKKKSFKELKASPTNSASRDNAVRDANTHNNVNSGGGH